MRAIRRFLNGVIRKDSSESTKRTISLVFALTTVYLVIRYTDEKNFTTVLLDLCGFVLLLLGVSAWEDIRTKRIEKTNENENTDNQHSPE